MRGFAGMSPEKRRAVARLGGKAAHKAGTAHTWTTEEAIKAGRKGGTATGKKRRKHLH
jgi:general stress protein YciG